MVNQGIASFMGGSTKEQQLRQQSKEELLNTKTPVQKRRERRAGLKGGEGETGGISKFATQLGAGVLPGAGVADVIGAFPDVEGGYEPSMLVNLQQAKRSFQEGNYKQAATQGIYGALQGLGGAGDAALAASPFAPFALPVAVGAKTVSSVGKKLVKKALPKKEKGIASLPKEPFNKIFIKGPFDRLIASGKKTLETRGNRLPEKYIGKPLVMKNEKNEAVGEVTFKGSRKIETKEEFDSLRNQHLVEEGSPFDFGNRKQTYVWEVDNVKKYTEPQKIEPMKGQAPIQMQGAVKTQEGIAALPTNNLEVEPLLGLDIMASTEKSFVKPSKANKVVIQDIYDYFDRPTKLNFDDPKQYDQMLQQAKKDFDYQIKQQVTGLDWYDGDIKETMKLLDEINPKFKNNQDAKDLTVFLTAILSSGTSVGQDITAATKVVDNYLNTGTVASKNPFSVYTKKEAEKFGKPEKAGEPKAWTAQTNTKALEFANSFIQDKGLRPFLDFLHTPTTRREASQIAEKYGLKPFSGKKDEQIVGANLFGPKIGKFMKNMMGMEGDEVVADIWFTRMMDRHSGNMFKMEAGKKNQNKTPRNVAEMQRNQKFVEDLFSLTGYNKRDIQAVLWYFEQGLYTKLGVKSEPKGYSDAIKSILKGRANDTGGSLPQTNETKIKAKRSEPTKLKKAFGGFVESSNYDHYRLI